MHGNKIYFSYHISKIYALSILEYAQFFVPSRRPVVSCLMMMITQIRDSVRPAATMTNDQLQGTWQTTQRHNNLSVTFVSPPSEGNVKIVNINIVIVAFYGLVFCEKEKETIAPGHQLG